MKQIIVTIDKGAATVETKGFTGKACQLETADLERALGATTADKLTAEGRTASTARTVKSGAGR